MKVGARDGGHVVETDEISFVKHHPDWKGDRKWEVNVQGRTFLFDDQDYKHIEEAMPDLPGGFQNDKSI